MSHAMHVTGPAKNGVKYPMSPMDGVRNRLITEVERNIPRRRVHDDRLAGRGAIGSLLRVIGRRFTAGEDKSGQYQYGCDEALVHNPR